MPAKIKTEKVTETITPLVTRVANDPELRERRRAAGLEMAKWRTWDHAAEQIEKHLRAALVAG